MTIEMQGYSKFRILVSLNALFYSESSRSFCDRLNGNYLIVLVARYSLFGIPDFLVISFFWWFLRDSCVFVFGASRLVCVK